MARRKKTPGRDERARGTTQVRVEAARTKDETPKRPCYAREPRRGRVTQTNNASEATED